MKILTYNINGLKAFAEKGLLDKLFDDFFDVDIFCFQEVKTDYKTVTDIFNKYSDINWYYDENTAKKGYAGTLTAWRNDDVLFAPTSTGITVHSNISVEMELTKYWSGRCVRSYFDRFNLINVYVPNSGKKELLREAFDESLLYTLTTLRETTHSIPTIIVGDMNVCSTELDYWGNYDKTLDTCPGLMRFEINDFHKLLDSGFVDAYRELNNDNRKYSYFPIRAKKFSRKQ